MTLRHIRSLPHVLNPDVMRTRGLRPNTTFSFIYDHEIWVSLTFLFNIWLPWFMTAASVAHRPALP